MHTLKIADIPEIRAKGGEKVPNFSVTETELLVLARYWRWTDLDIDTDRFLIANIGRIQMYFLPYVWDRRDAVALMVGEERFRELTHDIDERFRASMGDRRWEIFLRGNMDEWEVVRTEVQEALCAENRQKRLTGSGVRSSENEDWHAKRREEFPVVPRFSRPWDPDPLVFSHAPRGLCFDCQELPGFTPNLDELTVLATFWGTVLIEVSLYQPAAGDTHERSCSQTERQFAEGRLARLLKLIGRDRAALATVFVQRWASAELGERCCQLFPDGDTAEENGKWLGFWPRLLLRGSEAGSGVPSAGCDPQPKT